MANKKPKNMKYIGIDNGLSGALVVLEEQKIVESLTMPIISSDKNKREYDISAIVNFLTKYSDAIAIVEKTQAMPKLGTVQAHHLGKGFGIIVGILSALGIRYHVIHSKTWQSKLLRDCPGTDTKLKSILVTQRLFPKENFFRTERSKKIDHNLCDAALLAFYGQQYLYKIE